ncbi:MAG: M16 family metallopeptidase [Candidatus Methylacidiphilales bacterium]|nr:pitrilysin family protein [Candidatus Methylacidiphilales bacterium]
MPATSQGLTPIPSSTGKASSLPVSSVARHELSNGLNILVQSDYSAPVVSIQFWCATGSIHEIPWLGSGISHFLEHLMFKGTPTRGNSEMAQAIQDLGGHMNAYTSFDRTVYYVDLPSENWRPALDILSDSIANSIIPEGEFEKEREVIRREFAMGQDDPDRELGKMIFSTAFTRSPYRFPVIGLLDLFNQITRDDVVNYYKQRYTTQNLTLIVVGAVDENEVFQEAERLCGGLQRRPLPDLYLAEEPMQQSPRHARRTFPTQLSRLSMSWPVPGLHHEDIPALDVLSILMGEGRCSRLNQKIVEKEGLAESVSAYLYTPAHIGIWGVDARCAPEKHDALLTRLKEEVRLAVEEPSQEEVDRAKRLSFLQQVRMMKTMSGKAASLGSGWLLDRDPHFSRHYLDRLQGVTVQDVARVAAKYLLDHSSTLVEIVPEMGGVARSTAKSDAAKIPLQKHETPTGIRIIHQPSYNLPLSSLRAVCGASLATEPAGKAGINRLASQLLLKGTKRTSAEGLALRVEQLGGSIGADSGNNSASLGLELLSQDWATGLDIALEILSEVEPIEKELETERRKQISDLQEELDHPMAVARNLIRGALFPGHPYRHTALGTIETLENITVQDIRDAYSRAFLNQGMVFGIAGSMGPDQWRDTIGSRLASLPVSPVYSLPTLAPYPLAPVRVEEMVPKQQAVLQFAYPTVPLLHEDNLPLSIICEAMSDLGSRLFVKIREEMGLAYFVGASAFSATLAGYAIFYVGTDPTKRVAVESAMLSEIQNIADKGITTVELNRARAKMLSQETIHSQNPSYVAYAGALDELFGLGYTFAEKRQQRLRELTLEEVNVVARRYFGVSGYALAVVSPK